MNTIAIKRKKLIEDIGQLEDENLIDELYHFFRGERELSEEYILSEAQSEIVRKAEDEIKNGKFLTNEQAEKDIEEWFEK